jgi:hypothetical protein
LIQQKATNPENIGLEDVLRSVSSNTIGKTNKDSYLSEVQNNINFRVLFHLMNLAAHDKVHPQVNGMANKVLGDLKVSLLKGDKSATAREMVRRINAFNAKPDKFEVIAAPKLPDGSPIGMGCFH